MKNKVLASETIFEGKAFDVRRDQVEIEDGRMVVREIVAHAPAVTLIPIDEFGQIWFIRQYRHPIGEYILELPAGVVEEGESALETAKREIREEIGMAAEKIQQVGSFYLAPGYSTEYMTVFLAQGLFPAPLPGDDDEMITVEKMPVEEALDPRNVSLFRDSKTLASLLLVQPYIQYSGG